MHAKLELKSGSPNSHFIAYTYDTYLYYRCTGSVLDFKEWPIGKIRWLASSIWLHRQDMIILMLLYPIQLFYCCLKKFQTNLSLMYNVSCLLHHCNSLIAFRFNGFRKGIILLDFSPMATVGWMSNLGLLAIHWG